MDIYEVYHHGVKGQKWGVRRYQNRDGSLTARGKRRLAGGIVGFIKTKRAEAAKKKVAAAKQKASEEKKKAEQDVESKKAEILKSRSPKAVYENAHLFTDNELRSIKNRFDLEKSIKDLSPAEVSAGEKFVANSDKFSKIVESGGKAYNNIARIYNAFLGDAKDMRLPTIDFNNPVKRKTAEEAAKDKANKEKMQAEAKKAKAEAERINREADDINSENAKAKAAKNKTASEQPKTEKKADKEPEAEKVKAEWMPKSESSSKSDTNTSSKKQTIWDAEWKDVTDSDTTSSGKSYMSTSGLLEGRSSNLPAATVSAGQSYLDRLLKD